MKVKMMVRLLCLLLATVLLLFTFVSCDASQSSHKQSGNENPDTKNPDVKNPDTKNPDAEQPGDEQLSPELKIMTFNVLNGWNTSDIGSRDDKTAAKILELLPDVVGLQEFDDYYRNAVGTPLTSLISGKYAEVGADEASWNPLFYNKKTVELVRYGHENFTIGTSYDTYNYKGQIGSKFRTIMWAFFKHKGSGEEFLVLNTHLDVESEKHPPQVVEIQNKVTELKDAYGACPVFLIGDLNSSITTSTARSLFEFGFKDTHDLAEVKDDVTSCGTRGQPVTGAYKWAIDHVYCIGDRIAVSKYMTVTDMRPVSDHCPVMVTLELE